MEIAEIFRYEILGSGITIGDILVSVIIAVVGLIVIKVIVSALKRTMAKVDWPPLAEQFIVRVARGLMYLVLLGLVISPFGIDLTGMLVGLSLAGLIIGLALKDILANFFAGIMIAVYRPFKIGNWVEIGGTEGKVEVVGISFTMLRTGDNKKVLIPNNKVWGSRIVNHHAFDTRRIDMVVGISLDDDIPKALKVIRKVVEADSRILKEPAPSVSVRELGDYAIKINVRPWVKKEDYGAVKSALYRRIVEACTAEGISIPVPKYQVDVYERTPQL